MGRVPNAWAGTSLPCFQPSRLQETAHPPAGSGAPPRPLPHPHLFVQPPELVLATQWVQYRQALRAFTEEAVGAAHLRTQDGWWVGAPRGGHPCPLHCQSGTESRHATLGMPVAHGLLPSGGQAEVWQGHGGWVWRGGRGRTDQQQEEIKETL